MISRLHGFPNRGAPHSFVSYVVEGSPPPSQVSSGKLELQSQSSCHFTKCSCFLLFDSNDKSPKYFQICSVRVCVCVCVCMKSHLLPCPIIKSSYKNLGLLILAIFPLLNILVDFTYWPLKLFLETI